MADIDKKALIDEGCNLLNEAIAEMRKAQELFKKFGDVAPVVHGRWVEKEKYTFGIMYDCSLCEDRILDNGNSWNYCPNCGAKMDGGDGNIAMA